MTQTLNGKLVLYLPNHCRRATFSSSGESNCNNFNWARKTTFYANKNPHGFRPRRALHTRRYSWHRYYCAVDNYCDGFIDYQSTYWLKHGLTGLKTFTNAISGRRTRIAPQYRSLCMASGICARE